MMLRKPTLKFFALTKMGRLSIYGSLWKAVDRRNTQTELVLFVPNYLRNWARYFSLLEDYLIRPVKLRSGRVGILLQTGLDLKQMRKLVKIRFLKRHSFTPNSGFELATKRFKPKYVLVLIVLVLIGILSVPKLQNETTFSAPVRLPSCSFEIEAGSMLKRAITGRFTVAGKAIKVKSLGSFGGFAQLSVTRDCDRKKYEIRAWRTKLGYVVSKVD